MSATALQLNWTNVQFASTSLVRVTSVTFSQGGELIEFAGDNNRYPVVIANNFNRPRCSITSGDVATLMSIAPGTSGTITATQNDALGRGRRRHQLDDEQRRPPEHRRYRPVGPIRHGDGDVPGLRRRRRHAAPVVLVSDLTRNRVPNLVASRIPN